MSKGTANNYRCMLYITRGARVSTGLSLLCVDVGLSSGVIIGPYAHK